ncbi:MAG: radical SAM protein [Magnetococcales bacterium]|nr:radical SAM protein [Magnetococcales bacterium]
MKPIRKFQFLVPNTRWFGKRQWLWFTPAVPMLTPVLQQYGLEVEILEANIDNLTRDQVKERIRAFQPDIVGITNMSLEYWRQGHHAAQLAKEVDPAIITIMGGVHATTLPEKVMEDINIDHVILSEGEARLPKFLDILQTPERDFSQMDGIGYRVGGSVVIRPPEGYIEDLDALPLPDYTLFNWQKVMCSEQKSAVGLGSKRQPVGLILTSRGCRFRCCFCASPVISGRGVRLRSADSVLQEIDMLVQSYGIKELIFTDDEMYADRNRVVAILEGLKARNYDLIWKNLNQSAWSLDYDLLKLMKETGCYQVIVSPESGSERVLREIIRKPGNKQKIKQVAQWCRELGIEVDADFVIGFPGETWQEIRETCAFAEELDVDQIKFAIATPFPGTELFQTAVEGGYLPQDFDFYRDDTLGFAKGFIETEHFTVRELEMLRCFEWDRINFSTQEKRERFARMNMMTLEELEEFRRRTRRNVGVYFPDQVADEREEGDEVKTREEQSIIEESGSSS